MYSNASSAFQVISSNHISRVPGVLIEKRGLPNLSSEISQYSANEFARCNRHCAAFMTVCIPMWPQSNYYSLYLCPLRHHGRYSCVLLPKKTSSSKLKGRVHLFVFAPTAKTFHDRPSISGKQSQIFDNFTKYKTVESACYCALCTNLCSLSCLMFWCCIRHYVCMFTWSEWGRVFWQTAPQCSFS